MNQPRDKHGQFASTGGRSERKAGQIDRLLGKVSDRAGRILSSKRGTVKSRGKLLNQNAKLAVKLLQRKSKAQFGGRTSGFKKMGNSLGQFGKG